MSSIMSIWASLHSTTAIGIMAAIIALDTALAAVPSIEENSTFQVVSNTLKKVLGYFTTSK